MDKRLKRIDRSADSEARAQFYRDVAAGGLSLAGAVKAMRKMSRMTQPEFARHRGISVQALRQIETGTANPTIDTLNKVAAIYGLQVGFVPISPRASTAGARAAAAVPTTEN